MKRLTVPAFRTAVQRPSYALISPEGDAIPVVTVPTEPGGNSSNCSMPNGPFDSSTVVPDTPSAIALLAVVPVAAEVPNSAPFESAATHSFPYIANIELRSQVKR